MQSCKDPKRFQTDSCPFSFSRFHENQLFRLGVILAIIEANAAVSQLLPAITRNDKVRQFSPGFPKCPVPASVLPIAAALLLVSRGGRRASLKRRTTPLPLIDNIFYDGVLRRLRGELSAGIKNRWD